MEHEVGDLLGVGGIEGQGLIEEEVALGRTASGCSGGDGRAEV
jgi:hypothetical protein